MNKTNFEHLNGKRLYQKTTYLRDECAPTIKERFCKLEATKSTVTACGVIDEEDDKFVAITFDSDLVEKFISNDGKASFKMEGKTEIPDYLCMQTVGSRNKT
jgi:hypothetical protein